MKVLPFLASSIFIFSLVLTTAGYTTDEKQISSSDKREGNLQKTSPLIQRSISNDEMKSANSHYLIRKMKSKKNKNAKAAKSSKAPKQKKSSKKPKSSRTPTSAYNTRGDCVTVESYESDGSHLSNIIASMVENQDFSCYCQTDFDIAEAWFVDAENHPTNGKETDNDYMKASTF